MKTDYTDDAIHERAINKAESQIDYLIIEMTQLENTKPYMCYTQEMIDGQMAFKVTEIDVWRHIRQTLKSIQK